MFKEIFKTFLEEQLTDLAEYYSENMGEEVSIRLSMNNDYTVDVEETICANLLFGPESKIEGDYKSKFMNFNMTIWSEKNGNGILCQKLFKMLFDKFSMKSVSLTDADDDITYNAFLNFNDIVLMSSKEQCAGGFRSKWALQGQLIYSEASLIGRHTYITLNDLAETEIEVLNPSEGRNNNLEMKSTGSGIAFIKGGKAFTGAFSMIARDDEVSTLLLNYAHRLTDITKMHLKYEYQNLTITETKLVILSVDIAFDENTKNTVLTVQYAKDDVYGL